MPQRLIRGPPAEGDQHVVLTDGRGMGRAEFVGEQCRESAVAHRLSVPPRAVSADAARARARSLSHGA